MEPFLLMLAHMALDALINAYIFAMLSSPELVISVILHGLEVVMVINLREKVIASLPLVCRRVDRVTDAFKELAKVMLAFKKEKIVPKRV